MLITTFLLAAVVNAAELVGNVTKVSDGDTVWVTDNKGEREKIRLNGIDAPESTQAFGKKGLCRDPKAIYPYEYRKSRK